jgi:MYXO-CTERM domain-containing protein
MRFARRLGLVAIGLLVPMRAHAGNEAHPRTPVHWPGTECGRVIDRSVEPTIHFEYAVPVEDTQLGPEELPDSRTHQFFALCRQRPTTELLPNWISVDDVERSILAGLIEPGSVPASEVLDTSATWADCSVRITADDDRRPIDFATAEQGFDWDLADVPIGVWQVAGYTFEPPLDLWRAQPGFVKIVDDPDDPAQDLPAAHTAKTNGYWWPDHPNELELCVDVLEPATAILEWASFAPELVWTEFDRATIEQDGLVTLTTDGPSVAIIGASAKVEGLVRVRLIDALGRETVAHHPRPVIFELCLGHCADDPPPEDPPPEDPPDDDEPVAVDDGCGCSSGQPGPAWPLACIVLAIAGLARRSRRPA